ncbi:MAG: beta-lactamase family protein [Algicola sp.]|nr:beta-lactamase family protein [Algicola sp.]
MSNNKRIKFPLSAIAAAFILSGCGSDSPGGDPNAGPITPIPQPPQVFQGTLAAPIEGLSYTSGGQQGLTDATGAFSYEEGANITFNLGSLPIGNAVAGSASVALETLFTDGDADAAYNKVLQVLTVLDSDLNPVNGITIHQDALSAAVETLAALDLSSATFAADYSAFVNDVASQNIGAVELSALDALTWYQKLEIQTYMISQVSAKTLPGVTLSIELPNGELWHTAAGVANTASQTVMTPDHKFRIGSSTKSFVGLATMQLIDEGLLSLDQTVEEFLPGKFPYGPEMTIKMLLNHTAGMFSFTNEYPGFQAAFGVTIDIPTTDLWFYRYMENPAFIWGTNDLVDIGSAVNTAFHNNNATAANPYLMNGPGLVWNYANTHYVSLEKIIEQVTGNSWQHEVTTRFIEPLGMTNTHTPVSGEFYMVGPYADGYINWVDNQGAAVAGMFGYPNSDFVRTNTDPSYTKGSGAMTSTAPDLATWSRAVMEGELLSPATQALFRKPFCVANAFGEDVAMLQGVVHDLPNKIYGHRGQIAGYDASWQYRFTDGTNPANMGAPMVVLINRTLLNEVVNGATYVPNANDVILLGVLQILYGTAAVDSNPTCTTVPKYLQRHAGRKDARTKNLPLSEY